MTDNNGRYNTLGDGAEPVITRLAEQDKVPWYRKPHLRRLYIVMVPTLLGTEMTSGYDSSMMSGLQAVASWDHFYHHPRSSLLGLLTASYSLGSICGLPFVSPVSDRLGRRYSIICGSLFMLVGAVLQTASQNFAMFVTARFILGFGIPFAVIAGSSLVGELSHPKERPIMSSLFNSCWYMGSITAASVTMCTFAIPNNWAWRIPSIIQIVPSFLQITFIYFLPESPRWLVAKGRGSEALAILIKYHAEGDPHNEFVKAEYAQIEKTLELESEVSKKNSWGEMIATSGMRRRVMIASFLGVATQASGNGLITYYMAPILDGIGIHDNWTKNMINLSASCWALINATTIALTIPRIKRRTAYMICTISLLCIFSGWTFATAEYAITNSQVAAYAVIMLIYLYGPAYNIGYNALSYTYMLEIFPYHVRSRGLTIYQWWSKSATFLSQFVNPIGIAKIGWKFYIGYCFVIAFEVVFVYFLFPETSNRTLEELAFLYEGDEIRHEQQIQVEHEIQEARDEESLDDSEPAKNVATTSHTESVES